MPLAASGAWAEGGLCASSHAIALSIWGSPNSLANTKASTPAARPTSIPRIRSPRAARAPSIGDLVAGEAEEVAAVVDPLVERHARHEARGALLGADEVDEEDGQQREQDRVGDDVV